MSQLNIKKDKIQQQALKSWINADKIGTVEIITGLGKTFIGLHALYTMPKNDKTHLFLAEVVDRKKDLRDDIKKYNKIFNRDVLNDYKLQFKTYQSAYKLKNKSYGLVIADEIHDSLTPSYSEFYFNNQYDALIGLSALVDIKTYYKEINKTKGYFLNKIAPICFKYHLDQGLEEETARKLNIYVIEHQLDNTVKSIKAGTKKKSWYQTEQASYNYWDSLFKKNLMTEVKIDKKDTESIKEYMDRVSKAEDLRQLKINMSVNKRSKLLYDLPSKQKVVKKLLKHIKGKTILFGNSIDSLLNITKNTVSSRNNNDVNKSIRDNFEKGNINLIGSFKKLKQGANLNKLDNCVVMSYYSKEKDLIQRLNT